MPASVVNIETIEKKAGWARYYDFDFSRLAEFREDPPQTILTHQVAATPSGLTLGSTGLAGAVVQAPVSGGTAGTTYTLTCTITTSGGATLTLVGRLRVVA